MDPRRPELSITRLDELMEQYKKILNDMKTCNVSSRLAQFEREGGLVVQEICLVAPRLHEAMIQASRTRRAALAHGIVEEEPEISMKNVETHVESPVLTKKSKNVKTGKKKSTKKKKAE